MVQRAGPAPSLVLGDFLLTMISHADGVTRWFPRDWQGAVALPMLFYSLLGLGVAPTLVGPVTDRVLHDEMMLQTSMGVVAIATTVLGSVPAFILPRFYRAARVGP